MDNFWQTLPRDFKLSVVEILDYKSRCRLRKCSKSEKQLVESCPVKMNFLKIQFGLGKTAKLVFNETTETDFYPANDVINDFALIFQKSNSKTEKLEIHGFAIGSDPRIAMIIRDLVKKLRDDNLKIKAKNFKFWTNNFNDDETFLNLIQTFDVKTLQGLSACHFMLRDVFEKLAKTDHWKNLKKIGLGLIDNSIIDDVMHLEKIRFEVEKILPEDVWKLIQNFLIRNLPIGSYFDVNCLDAEVDQILEHFRKKGVKLENEPINNRDAEKYIHTQRFKIPLGTQTEERVLLLKMNINQIYGFVGRASRYQ